MSDQNKFELSEKERLEIEERIKRAKKELNKLKSWKEIKNSILQTRQAK